MCEDAAPSPGVFSSWFWAPFNTNPRQIADQHLTEKHPVYPSLSVRVCELCRRHVAAKGVMWEDGGSTQQQDKSQGLATVTIGSSDCSQLLAFVSSDGRLTS